MEYTDKINEPYTTKDKLIHESAEQSNKHQQHQQ